jgi:rhomboid protease GluP
MTQISLKFKLIYFRLLYILFCFVAAYSFLHWLLFIKLQVYDTRENVVVWVVPLVLPFLPVWIWWRKRIKLLNLKTKKDNLFFNLLLVAHLFIGAVTIATQYFLISATGELRVLSNPAAITQYRLAKYYTFGQYYADKSSARQIEFSYTSGKRNRDLTYEAVIAVPLYNRSVDTVQFQGRVLKDEGIVAPPAETVIEAPEPVKIKTISDTAALPKPAAWVCLYYKTSLDNRISLEERNEAWDDFIEQSYQDFAQQDFYSFAYFEYPGNNELRDKYIKAVGGLRLSGIELPYVLSPGTEPYANRYDEELVVIFGVLIIGGTVLLVMVLLRPFDDDALKKFIDEWEHVEAVTFRGYI